MEKQIEKKSDFLRFFKKFSDFFSQDWAGLESSEEENVDKTLVVNCPEWFDPLSMMEKWEAIKPILAKIPRITAINFPPGMNFAVFEGAAEVFPAAKAEFQKLKVRRSICATSLVL